MTGGRGQPTRRPAWPTTQTVESALRTGVLGSACAQSAAPPGSGRQQAGWGSLPPGASGSRLRDPCTSSSSPAVGERRLRAAALESLRLLLTLALPSRQGRVGGWVRGWVRWGGGIGGKRDKSSNTDEHLVTTTSRGTLGSQRAGIEQLMRQNEKRDGNSHVSFMYFNFCQTNKKWNAHLGPNRDARLITVTCACAFSACVRAHTRERVRSARRRSNPCKYVRA